MFLPKVKKTASTSLKHNVKKLVAGVLVAASMALVSVSANATPSAEPAIQQTSQVQVSAPLLLQDSMSMSGTAYHYSHSSHSSHYSHSSHHSHHSHHSHYSGRY